jgi:chromosome segregation ATPase
MRVAADVAGERAEKHARRDELAARIPELEEDTERIRDQVGRAVAQGEEPRQLRAHLRDIVDELDGLRRAVGVLDSDMAELAREEADRAAAEADQRAEELAGEAEAALAAAAEEALAFLRRFEGLEAAANAAFAAAVGAEREADRANGRRPPHGHPRVAARIQATEPLMSAVPVGQVRLALRNALLAAGLEASRSP